MNFTSAQRTIINEFKRRYTSSDFEDVAYLRRLLFSHNFNEEEVNFLMDEAKKQIGEEFLTQKRVKK